MSQTKPHSTSQHTRHMTQPVVVTMGEKRWVVGGEESGATIRYYDPYAYPSPPSDSSIVDDSIAFEEKQETDRVRRGRSIFERLAEATEYLFHDVHEGRRPLTPLLKRSAGFRPTGAVRGKGRRLLRETFQIGCAFGLLLGCLSLILFHQMEPTSTPKAASTAGANAVDVASEGPAFVVPSIKLYVLQAGPFSTDGSAKATQERLAQLGYRSSLHREGGKVDLWFGLSITPGGLKSITDGVSKTGIHTSVRSLAWKAHSVPGVTGANVSSMQQVSRWLSSAASSLTALTATLADGGVPQDATTAFSVTRSLLPSAEQFRDTGRKQALTALHDDLHTAFTAYSQHRSAEARQGVIKAADDLMQLQH